MASEILGHDDDDDDVDTTNPPFTAITTTSDLLEAMQKFTSMKEELIQLQRESQLTQRALVATQCSQTFVAKRLEKIPNDSDNESMVDEETEANEEEQPLEDDDEEDDDVDDEDIMEDVPSPEDDNLEQEIMNILPTKSRSLGVGLLGDMEQCIVEWQQTFQDLNDQHESQVQACQADLERLHVQLDAMQALQPCAGIEAAEAAKKARDQLEQLVKIVEEFPSKARVEALQRELAASKQVEEQTHMELARAVEELEALRQREKDLIRRLEVATRPPIPLQRPKTGPVPTVRLLRYTKKKLQRLFHLDRCNTTNGNNTHKPSVAPRDDDEANSCTSPSVSESALLDTMIDSGVQSIDLSQLTPAITKEDFLAPKSSSPGTSPEEDLEELSVTDSLENFHRHDVLSVYGSPSKSHSTEEDDLDLCKMDTDDTTSTRSEATSYLTETETDSSSGTPPPKLKNKHKQQGTAAHESTSKTLFHMAKSLLWVQ